MRQNRDRVAWLHTVVVRVELLEAFLELGRAELLLRDDSVMVYVHRLVYRHVVMCIMHRDGLVRHHPTVEQVRSPNRECSRPQETVTSAPLYSCKLPGLSRSASAYMPCRLFHKESRRCRPWSGL